MTPDGAVQLLNIYASAQAALERDETEPAGALIESATALIVEAPPPDADPIVLRALAEQVEAARCDAVAALTAARDRLLRAANAELRAGGSTARAYAGSDEQPDPRFIDRSG